MSEHLDLGIGISAAGAQQSARQTRSLIGSLKEYIKQMVSFRRTVNRGNDSFSTHVHQVRLADEGYQRLGDSLRKLRNRLLAFLGVYTVTDVFRRAIQEGSELEQLYTRMANRFGSDQMGRATGDWIIQMESRLPVAREELESFVGVLDEFAIPPQLANLEGVLNAALGPGGDLNSVLSQIVTTAQSGDIQPFMEAFQGRISPTEISNALQGAVSVQERIINLTDLLDERFQGNIERQQRTVQGQMGLLSGLFNLFQKAFVGDPHVAGTFFGEWSRFVQQFTGWFLEREEDIINFGRELGSFFGQLFRLFRQNFINMGEFSDRMFRVLRQFIDNSRELVNPFILFLAVVMNRMTDFFEGFLVGFRAFFTVMSTLISSIASRWAWLLEEVFGITTEDQLSWLESFFGEIFDPEVLHRFGQAAGFAFAAFLAFTTITSLVTRIGAALMGLGKAILFLSGGFLGLNPYIAGTIAILTALWVAYEENLFGLQELLAPVFEWLSEKFGEGGSALEWFEGVWERVVTQLAVYGEILGDAFRSVFGSILDFWEEVREPVNKIKDDFIENWLPAILDGLDWLKTALLDVVMYVVNIIADGLQRGWQIIEGILKGLIGLLSGDMELAKEGLQGIWDGFVGYLGDIFGHIDNLVGDFFRGVWASITDWWTNTISSIQERFEIISGFFKRYFSGIVFFFANMMDGIKNAAIMAWDVVVATIRRAWEIIKSGVELIIGLLTGDMPRAWEGFKGMVSGLVAWASDIGQAIADFMGRMFRDIWDNFGDHIKRVANLWKEIFGGVFSWISNQIDRFVGTPLRAVGRFLGIVSDDEADPATATSPEAAGDQLLTPPAPEPDRQRFQTGSDILNQFNVPEPEVTVTPPTAAEPQVTVAPTIQSPEQEPVVVPDFNLDGLLEGTGVTTSAPESIIIVREQPPATFIDPEGLLPTPEVGVSVAAPEVGVSLPAVESSDVEVPVMEAPEVIVPATTGQAAGKTIHNNDNRTFQITVQQAPGESPEQTARRIYRELQREERRNRERRGEF